MAHGDALAFVDPWKVDGGRGAFDGARGDGFQEDGRAWRYPWSAELWRIVIDIERYRTLNYILYVSVNALAVIDEEGRLVAALKASHVKHVLDARKIEVGSYNCGRCSSTS